MKLTKLLFFLVTASISASVLAQEEDVNLEMEKDKEDEPSSTENLFPSRTLQGVRFTGYIDIFGSYQTTQPTNRQNPYSSYPFHSNEIGISYAYVQAKYEDSKMMGTVALNAGNIVDLMYYEEPPLLKLFRELSVGYKFSKNWWIDAGIFPSIYGTENFITKNNFHATRSITGDFSPDFEEGVRLNYRKEYWQVKFLITNGWQTLEAPANTRRAFGTMVEYHIPGRLKINWSSYNGMVQQHPPVDLGLDAPLTFRQFDNLFIQYFSGRWSFYSVVDLGWQRNLSDTGWDHWVGNSNSIRYKITDHVATSVRYDNFWDPTEKVMFPSMPDDYVRGTGNWPNTVPGGFQVDSFTWTLDYSPVQNILFRFESRFYQSRTGVAIFPDENTKQTTNAFFLASMGFSFGK